MQREKTPTPSHHKGGSQSKAVAHSAKQPPPGKQGSLSKQGSLQKTPSSIDRDFAISTPKQHSHPGQKKKNKKKAVYDLFVRIDIVSVHESFIGKHFKGNFKRFRTRQKTSS